MKHFLFVTLAFLSLFFFPWPYAAVLALCFSCAVPFLPVAMGMLADALHYTPQAASVPFCSLYGALATGAALFIRGRLSASIMRK